MLKLLELFAGVGGIGLGFEKIGDFEIIFANDIDKNCKITYDLNHKNIQLFVEDIRNINVKTQIPDFDILLGGFPCQAFSVAGYRQGFNDKKNRGNLVFRIADILEEKKPNAFLLENVKNLKKHDNGKTYQIIKNLFTDLGYTVKEEILNGMTHGNIPQNRERIFIVGFLNKKNADDFHFPEPISLTRNFKNFLESKVDEKYHYNNKPLFERIKYEIRSEDSVYQWRRKYVRENKKGVCPTLTANMGLGGHNVPIVKVGEIIRKLTPSECFALQGYPKNFILPKKLSDTKLYCQAGNSIIVPIIERIAKNMKSALKK